MRKLCSGLPGRCPAGFVARCAALALAVVMLAAGALACRPPTAPVAEPSASRPASRAATPAREPDARSAARLPSALVPLAYDLEIAVDPADTGYAGTVAIDIRIDEPTSTLWLHAEQLQITDASLHLAGGRRVALGAPIARGDRIGFAAGETLAPGKATLRIAFRGALGERAGAFRQLSDGEAYVFTDFEPIDARRAFPCFDEPRFKTPWRVSLIIPEAMHGLSNMPEVAVEPVAEGKKRVRFAPTRPLPTYLVAFAVGPFEMVDAPGRSGEPLPVPLRIVVPRGKAAWARSAAEMAPELLRVVIDYFQMPVPFPKLDLIAVPMFSGAMENPGLITVGAHILLADPQRPSIRQQRLLALVCAHEFAHLWFGDLVTLADWNELWLNEGFATWLADKALVRWNADAMPHVDQIVAKIDAMAMDQHAGVRAVRQVGHGREDLARAFDALSYKKGGALLAMFEAWLSDAVFREAVLAYIAAHADGSATTGGLMRAISAVAGRDLAAAFASFLDQPGIPHVRAELTCDSDGPQVELSQRPYVALSDLGSRPDARDATTPATPIWHVPVCMRYDAGNGATARQCVLFDSPRMRVPLETERCPAWLMPNAGGDGYYRYHMPAAQLMALARAPLTEREATDLVHDLRALLYSGDARAGDVLPMLAQLAEVPSRHTIEAILAVLEDVGEHLLPGEQAATFQAYVRQLFGKRARALGFASRRGESDEDVLLRPALLGFVGLYGQDPWVSGTARRLADTWLRTGRGIERGMIATTLKAAAAAGDARLFARIEARLRGAREDEQPLLLGAMAAFRQLPLIERSLALVMDERLGRRHELLMDLLAGTSTRGHALAFLAAHQDALARDAQSAYLLAAPLWSERYCSDDELDRVAALAARVPRARDMVVERLAEVARAARACAFFREAQAPSARAFFR